MIIKEISNLPKGAVGVAIYYTFKDYGDDIPIQCISFLDKDDKTILSLKGLPPEKVDKVMDIRKI